MSIDLQSCQHGAESLIPFPATFSTPLSIPHRPLGPAQGPITVKVAPHKQEAAMLHHNT